MGVQGLGGPGEKSAACCFSGDVCGSEPPAPVAGRPTGVRPAISVRRGAMAAPFILASMPVTIWCQFTGARRTGDADGRVHVRHDARIAAWRAKRARGVLEWGPRGCGRRLICSSRLATRPVLGAFLASILWPRPLSPNRESCEKRPLGRTPLAIAAEHETNPRTRMVPTGARE